eukprot:sb/3474741/
MVQSDPAIRGKVCARVSFKLRSNTGFVFLYRGKIILPLNRCPTVLKKAQTNPTANTLAAGGIWDRDTTRVASQFTTLGPGKPRTSLKSDFLKLSPPWMTREVLFTRRNLDLALTPLFLGQFGQFYGLPKLCSFR